MTICQHELTFRTRGTDAVASRAPAFLREREYIAVKGLSESGFYYLLLVRDAASTQLITFETTGGLRVREIAPDESKALGDTLFRTELSQYKSVYGEPQFHGHCGFVRVHRPPSHVDLHFLNVDLTAESDNPLTQLLSRFDALLEDAYADVDWESAQPMDPEELSESSVRELREKIDKDVFYELTNK